MRKLFLTAVLAFTLAVNAFAQGPTSPGCGHIPIPGCQLTASDIANFIADIL